MAARVDTEALVRSVMPLSGLLMPLILSLPPLLYLRDLDTETPPCQDQLGGNAEGKQVFWTQI